MWMTQNYERPNTPARLNLEAFPTVGIVSGLLLYY